MSTLKVATIQDTSGNNSSTPAEVASGRCKAWVNFNGDGTLAVRDSYNVSSVTDLGTGNYQVNFTNSMPNANYCFTGCVGFFAVRGGMINPYGATTTSVKFEGLRQNANGVADYEECNAAIFAD